jgi:hypothetical protein
VIERAYVLAERLGLPLWCEDEAGPYQTIPRPGSSFQPEGEPKCQDHQYIRGKTCKLLTLLRPATGELRAEPVDQSTNAILHPWLKKAWRLDSTGESPGWVSSLARFWVDCSCRGRAGARSSW